MTDLCRGCGLLLRGIGELKDVCLPVYKYLSSFHGPSVVSYHENDNHALSLSAALVTVP